MNYNCCSTDQSIILCVHLNRQSFRSVNTRRRNSCLLSRSRLLEKKSVTRCLSSSHPRFTATEIYIYIYIHLLLLRPLSNAASNKNHIRLCFLATKYVFNFSVLSTNTVICFPRRFQICTKSLVQIQFRTWVWLNHCYRDAVYKFLHSQWEFKTLDTSHSVLPSILPFPFLGSARQY